MNDFTHTVEMVGMTEKHKEEMKTLHDAMIKTQEQYAGRLFLIMDDKAHYDWRGRFKMGKESMFSRFMGRAKL